MLTSVRTATLLKRVGLSLEEIIAYCDRWQICEFALFGSVLCANFNENSDLDCLVTFAPDVRWGLFSWLEMERELSDRIGRPVDIVLRSTIEASPNPITRTEILSTAQTLYPSLDPPHIHPAEAATHHDIFIPPMNPDQRDLATVLDIVRTSQVALDMSTDLSLETFQTDVVRQSAILYQLTILGEAVKRLSPAFRDRYPDIPWRNIAGLRDILIHEYHRVDLALVAEILDTKLPTFAEQVREISRERH